MSMEYVECRPGLKNYKRTFDITRWSLGNHSAPGHISYDLWTWKQTWKVTYHSVGDMNEWSSYYHNANIIKYI